MNWRASNPQGLSTSHPWALAMFSGRHRLANDSDVSSIHCLVAGAGRISGRHPGWR